MKIFKHCALAIAIVVIVCAPVFSQTDIVKSDGINSDLHRANVGRLVVVAKPAAAEVTAADFLTTIDLGKPTALSIRVFLSNSLTNHLHKLAPQLSIDELNRQGNYQFSYFVDGALIYQENLNPFWVGFENKNKQTIFPVTILDLADPDRPRLWQLFLMNGGDDALTPGTHRVRIELRPYVRAPEVKVGELLAAGDIQVVVPAKAKQVTAVQPIRPGSGWEISKASYDKTRIEKLNSKIADNLFKDVKSLVVIKDGKLLIEEYFGGATRDTLHNTRSVGKSFVSPIMGIAIREGHIKSENQTLKDFYDLQKFANYSPKKESVTIRSLLTMSSAFDGNDDDEDSPGNEEKMYPTADWVKFALDVPMDDKKKDGEKWTYFTAGVVVLGDILNKSVPEGLEKYADKNLFKPLGITKYEWGYTPQKVPNTAGGIQLTALDLAKFGELHRNGGSWHGKQIVPRDWVAKSFTRQIGLDNTTNYGYLFWNTSINIGGKKHEAFFATGNGGSKIFIFKDQPLVVVITSTAFGKWFMHTQAFNMMERYILPAVIK
jgi:CubicO group peptidase (beta-lactamase class C family)